MRKLSLGDKVIHFKWECGKEKKDCIYTIVGFAKDANDLSDLVIYQSENTGVLWVRELDNFNSLVDTEKYPNVNQKYRFELYKL